MDTRSTLTLLAILLSSAFAQSTRADMVMRDRYLPCPPGAYVFSSHGASYCAPLPCTDGRCPPHRLLADETGRCETVGICIRVEHRGDPRRRPARG